ncbi:MAG: ABC transporter ATP-binding protein [Candidatus Latescibacteria bacterium]|nr:ABC transporter ATP-binding protein [Candidatus Latescibacterota bacterium]
MQQKDRILIETKNLRKIYNTGEIETVALNNVNLTVNTGEFIAIMGPSGCGKSTLLNLLGLIDNLTSGEYYFLGYEVSQCSERKRSALRKKNISFIFQNFNLIDELTVFENVELPLTYLKTPVSERKEKVRTALEQMNVYFKKDHFPHQLSGGQQQLIAIARSLITNPVLILADEPTGNLDSANGKDVMQILSALNENGTSIVMVTHSSECADYSRRIVHLFDGHIVSEKISQ